MMMTFNEMKEEECFRIKIVFIFKRSDLQDLKCSKNPLGPTLP